MEKGEYLLKDIGFFSSSSFSSISVNQDFCNICLDLQWQWGRSTLDRKGIRSVLCDSECNEFIFLLLFSRDQVKYLKLQ